MKLKDFIAKLEKYDPEMMVRAGRYDTWSGEWILSRVSTDVLYTDKQGSRDLTDKERDQDIATLIIY